MLLWVILRMEHSRMNDWETRRKYSKEDQQKYKAFGYKVFYHRALITEGDLMLNPREGREYAFVTADELDQYLDKETTDYLKRILD